MRGNPLRAKLQRDEPVFGPMILELASPGLPQIFANAGADFIMYDQEAGCLDDATIKMQIALTRVGVSSDGETPLARLPFADTAVVLRRDGAAGGGCESRTEAEAIARITHYPPFGVRGAAFGIAHDDYAGTDLEGAIRTADERTLVAVKIETVKGVENIDEIIRFPGIDIAFVNTWTFRFHSVSRGATTRRASSPV
jgi:2-keto-3-deoxy-L-rhamnonate aldolase RhmA